MLTFNIFTHIVTNKIKNIGLDHGIFLGQFLNNKGTYHPGSGLNVIPEQNATGAHIDKDWYWNVRKAIFCLLYLNIVLCCGGTAYFKR